MKKNIDKIICLLNEYGFGETSEEFKQSVHQYFKNVKIEKDENIFNVDFFVFVFDGDVKNRIVKGTNFDLLKEILKNHIVWNAKKEKCLERLSLAYSLAWNRFYFKAGMITKTKLEFKRKLGGNENFFGEIVSLFEESENELKIKRIFNEKEVLEYLTNQMATETKLLVDEIERVLDFSHFSKELHNEMHRIYTHKRERNKKILELLKKNLG